MTFEIFITILTLSATATSFAIELVKKVLNYFGHEYKTQPMAVIIAFVVGVAEIIVYNTTNGMSFNVLTVVYALCMGIVNALSATAGYDLVKDFLYALFAK